MNPAEELIGIVGQLRNRLMADKQMGLALPSLSPQSMAYLDKRPEDQSLPNSLEDLRRLIGDCRRCKLWRHRNNLVFGEGSPTARLVFISDGPGDEEDKAGQPFQGEAGKLLTRIIENGMGLSRDDVYICSIIKCKRPDHRDPERDEVKTCIPFLKQQIRIIRPEVICVLGRIAGQEILGKDFMVTHERGKWHSFLDIPVMPTYHPAYILRKPSKQQELKGQVWKDIQEIMARLGLEVKQ